MRDIDKHQAGSSAGACKFDTLMHELRVIVIDGIKHGHFKGEIAVDVVGSGRREILISAGKSYRFVIGLDDLPR